MMCFLISVYKLMEDSDECSQVGVGWGLRPDRIRVREGDFEVCVLELFVATLSEHAG